MRLTLKEAGPCLLGAPPRRVGPPSARPPIIILTDGACEPVVSIGGVIIDGDFIECFGAVLAESTISAWRTRRDQTQVIGQAELYPTLVARLTWSERMANRKVIYFIDNDSARLALIKSYSPVLPSLEIVLSCIRWDFTNGSVPWYSRVPTASNLSDGPSRMDLEIIKKSFCARVVQPTLPEGDAVTCSLE